MVEFPLLVRRQGFALRLGNLSQIPRSADINFVSSNRDLALADMWETITFAATFHARLNVAAVDVFQAERERCQSQADRRRSAAGGRAPATSICYKLRNTEAGFWLSASKVPASPSPTVTSSAASTTPAALAVCQTKVSVIRRVTISQAATDPAITPKTAVATPIMRYSSA